MLHIQYIKMCVCVCVYILLIINYYLLLVMLFIKTKLYNTCFYLKINSFYILLLFILGFLKFSVSLFIANSIDMINKLNDNKI